MDQRVPMDSKKYKFYRKPSFKKSGPEVKHTRTSIARLLKANPLIRLQNKPEKDTRPKIELKKSTIGKNKKINNSPRSTDVTTKVLAENGPFSKPKTKINSRFSSSDFNQSLLSSTLYTSDEIDGDGDIFMEPKKKNHFKKETNHQKEFKPKRKSLSFEDLRPPSCNITTCKRLVETKPTQNVPNLRKHSDRPNNTMVKNNNANKKNDNIGEMRTSKHMVLKKNESHALFKPLKRSLTSEDLSEPTDKVAEQNQLTKKGEIRNSLSSQHVLLKKKELHGIFKRGTNHQHGFKRLKRSLSLQDCKLDHKIEEEPLVESQSLQNISKPEKNTRKRSIEKTLSVDDIQERLDICLIADGEHLENQENQEFDDENKENIEVGLEASDSYKNLHIPDAKLLENKNQQFDYENRNTGELRLKASDSYENIAIPNSSFIRYGMRSKLI